MVGLVLSKVAGENSSSLNAGYVEYSERIKSWLMYKSSDLYAET